MLNGCKSLVTTWRASAPPGEFIKTRLQQRESSVHPATTPRRACWPATAVQCFFLLTKTKTITSKRNSVVLWHVSVLIIADMKCSCLSVLVVYATHHIANCVALTILIGTELQRLCVSDFY